MKRFEYIPAATITEVIQVLSREGERAKVIAGGTDLITRLRMGKEEAPDYIVSLRRLKELDYLIQDGEGALHIGALATLRSVEEDHRVRANFPALAEAAASVGSLQVRNLGTVVGNVCSASSAADTAIALLSLGAVAKVIGPRGERDVDLTEFFASPRRTHLRSGEMVKEVCLPAPAAGLPALEGRIGGSFMRVSPRSAMDCSVAAVAATVKLGKDGKMEEVGIGLGAVAPTPIRAKSAEEILKGQRATSEVLAAAAEAAARECQPIQDIRGSVEYRREMVKVLLARAVEEACGRAG